MKKKFDLTMEIVLIFAVVYGIYTSLMAIIPWFKDTSFRYITNLIMEDKDGNKTFFELIVNYNNYDIKRKLLITFFIYKYLN